MIFKSGGKEYPSRGIYKIEGDTITYCWATSKDKPRPKKFESTPDSGVVLMVFVKTTEAEFNKDKDKK